MDFDVIAVGDITTDAFIKLKDAHVSCTINSQTCELCMKFGAKIPYESRTIVPAVGNSANASVAMARIGLRVALVTNQGDDASGHVHLEVLRREKIGTHLVTTHPKKSTNYHYVLWYGAERTILVKHEAYDYMLPEIGNPKWIYLSSLGEDTLDYHTSIVKYLASHKNIKLAFQPGTFQLRSFAELRPLYEQADVLIMNTEEARDLTKESGDVVALLKALRLIGSKHVVITDGPKGAYYLGVDGFPYFMPIYPDPKEPYERTGAGDAFASTFVSMLVLGKSPLEALELAPINSMSVVQEIGAQRGLLTREKLMNLRSQAPADYAPRKI